MPYFTDFVKHINAFYVDQVFGCLLRASKTMLLGLKQEEIVGTEVSVEDSVLGK